MAVRDVDTIFYDGTCGLCHRAVKFVLKRDTSGHAFRFAPLQGETFRSMVSPEKRNGLPNSVFVLTAEGTFLVRSDAWVHILYRCGRRWRIAGSLLASLPKWLRNGLYDFVASIRYPVFGRRSEMCPVVDREQRARFEP